MNCQCLPLSVSRLMLCAEVAAFAFVANGGTLTVRFGSAMDVEIDGGIQTFAKNATFIPTAVPCVYKMRPSGLEEGERTFAIASDEQMLEVDVYRFPQYGDGDWVRVALNPYPAVDTTNTLTAIKATRLFYADAARGNDGWDGTADYEHRDESINKGPKKTLQAAHDAATTESLVFAAPGVYDAGVSTNYASGTTYPCSRRLIATKKHIGFIATDGVENTFLVGARDPDSSNGCGADAVSGVYFDSNYPQFLQGFTITGCYSPASQEKNNQYGTAFNGGGSYRGYCLDCIISNNCAASMAAACNYGIVKRTRIFENTTVNYVTRYGVFSSCVFAGNMLTYGNTTGKKCGMHYYGNAYFCTYDLRNAREPAGRKRVGNETSLYDCLVYGLVDKAEATEAGNKWYGSQAIDSPAFVDTSVRDYRLTAESPAVDSARAYAEFAVNERRMAMSDVDGLQRIMNGRGDLGASEFDWRPMFSRELKNNFMVDCASPSVTTNASGGLTVASGLISGRFANAGKYSLKAFLGSGSICVYVGDELVKTCSEAGEQRICFSVANPLDEVRIVYTPDEVNPEAAIFRRFSGPSGLMIFVQ